MEYSCKEVMDGIYHIGDGKGNFCTLLQGREGAILFDTMTGEGDLGGFVRGLSAFAPMVINSHCHFDHMGGNYQFERVYMSPAELPLLEVGLGEVDTLEETLRLDLSAMRDSFANRERVHPIQPGAVVDLGGLTARVVDLSGHTPGSIGLLIPERRLLLMGDAASPQTCLFFPESLSLEHYAALLGRLDGMEFDGFLSAHYDTLFPKTTLAKFRACVDLVGVKRGIDYAFAPLPYLKGKVYVRSVRDEELGQMVCIITKPEQAPLRDGGR